MQMTWLEEQLKAAVGTELKFIISFHVYDGARYQGNDLWKEEPTKEYNELLRDYHENIVIEVGAHDHYADLRYHSSHNVPDLKDTSEQFYFHNIVINPGITPNKGQNPGIAMLEIDENNLPINV